MKQGRVKPDPPPSLRQLLAANETLGLPGVNTHVECNSQWYTVTTLFPRVALQDSDRPNPRLCAFDTNKSKLTSAAEPGKSRSTGGWRDECSWDGSVRGGQCPDNLKSVDCKARRVSIARRSRAISIGWISVRSFVPCAWKQCAFRRIRVALFRYMLYGGVGGVFLNPLLLRLIHAMKAGELFPNLLSTNTAPEPADIPIIRRELALRKEAIYRHLLHLEELEAEFKAYESILAPLRYNALPFEVLAAIFSQALSDCDPKDFASRLLTMCLVCKTWLGAALATPRLWATIDVQVDTTTRFDYIRQWVAHSKAVPRSIGITVATNRVPPHETATNPSCDGGCPLRNPILVDMLAEDSIQEFTLKCDYMKCFQHLLNDVKLAATTSRMPWSLLKSLTVDLCRWTWRANEEELTLNVFHHLPASLTSLTLTMPSFILLHLEDDPTPLALPELAHLSLECEWEPWILKCLDGCPKLETLVLDFGQLTLFQGEVDDDKERTLPYLRSLRLRQLASEGDVDILLRLSCPSLTELSISFDSELGIYFDEQDEFASVLVDFGRRSGCLDGLTHLMFHSFSIESDAAIPIFRAFHSVTHFTMDCVRVEAFLFERLKNEGLLPRLEVLKILNAVSAFGYTKVMDWVTDRNRSVLLEEHDERDGRPSTRIGESIITVAGQYSDIQQYQSDLWTAERLKGGELSIALKQA
ncbi:hypothetical protein NMY22_g11665 [Coprinellus aureogranulatus]|nr:hypothetical protein NMY22_g11665 [Coprinellus aureogranulatus]